MSEVFPIVPASARAIWFLVVVLAVLSLGVAAIGYTAWSARHARVELRGAELALVGDFWGRSIPLESLRIDEAEVLELSAKSEYAPRWRTFGTGLPGYAAGWFRLRNGEKALAYLTTRSQVLYLPTSLGYSLLLSAERPGELLDALRRARR